MERRTSPPVAARGSVCAVISHVWCACQVSSFVVVHISALTFVERYSCIVRCQVKLPVKVEPSGRQGHQGRRGFIEATSRVSVEATSTVELEAHVELTPCSGSVKPSRHASRHAPRHASRYEVRAGRICVSVHRGRMRIEVFELTMCSVPESASEFK